MARTRKVEAEGPLITARVTPQEPTEEAYPEVTATVEVTARSAAGNAKPGAIYQEWVDTQHAAGTVELEPGLHADLAPDRVPVRLALAGGDWCVGYRVAGLGEWRLLDPQTDAVLAHAVREVVGWTAI